MGGSGEDPNKGTNQSPWPVEILGPEMLPEGYVAAPRSGKLLGTDDAKFAGSHDSDVPSPPLKMKSSRFSLDQESISLPKRKNRQCALLKILKLTKMASGNIGEQLLSPNGSSVSELEGSRKDDPDSDGDVSIITKSEFLGNLLDAPLVVEEKSSAGLSSIIADAPHQSSQSSRVHASPFPSEENESPKVFPEWRSKGKRNSRPRKSSWGQDVGFVDTGPRPIVQIRSVPFRQARLTVNPKYDMSGSSPQPDPSAGRYLLDIPIEVRSSSRSRRVPYRSVASQLAGCPIVGHPLKVEVLDEGKHRARKSSKSKKSKGLVDKKSRGKKKLLPGEMAKKSSTVACVSLDVVFRRLNVDLCSSASSSGSRRSIPSEVVG